MKKYNRIMELFWGSAAVISLGFVSYVVYNTGFDEAGLFFLLPFFCAMLWAMRRTVRKRMEKENAKHSK